MIAPFIKYLTVMSFFTQVHKT